MNINILQLTESPIELIYKAYRICYSKDKAEDIKVPSEDKMIEFIKDKIDKGHESPLEHVSITFSISGISRATLSQLTRHRTGKFSVQSQRYVDAKNFEYVIPEPLKGSNFENGYKNINTLLFEAYESLVSELVKEGMDKKIAQENARYILPNSTTCNLIVTMDLRNFRNFLNLRLCNHAQVEIREMANQMKELVKKELCFVDYKVMNCGKTCNDCFTHNELKDNVKMFKGSEI